MHTYSLNTCLRVAAGNTQKCSTPGKPPVLARNSTVSATAIDIAQKKHSLPVTSHNNMSATPSVINNGRTTCRREFGGDTKESSSPNHQITWSPTHKHTRLSAPQSEPGSATLSIYRYHAVGSWEDNVEVPQDPSAFPAAAHRTHL
jgi:hypothetical protein